MSSVPFLMRLALAGLAAVLLGETALAATPRPAPNFTYDAVGGRKSLRNLHGQPVLLLVAKSPRTKAFRNQVKALRDIYPEFAGRGTVFVVAFSEKDGQVPSDIPFVIANDGPAVAAAYDLQGDMVVAIIGRDGNLDSITNKMLPAFRIREVMQNNYEVQNTARKETPKGPPR